MTLTKASLILLASSILFGQALAREPSGNGVLDDGKLTREELAAAMLTAERDLSGMLEQAIVQVEDDMASAGIFAPAAWMVMKDRELKSVKLSSEADQAPPSIKVQMYRASLRSLARHNRIDAVLIVYPGTITKDGVKERVVVVEHEHRLGVSGLKLIPLSYEQSEANFGAPIDQDKEFQIFYDEKA